MIHITWPKYHKMAVALDKKIQSQFPSDTGIIYLIGIPRGGMLVALHLTYLSTKYEIVDPETIRPFTSDKKISAFCLVDDVLETGTTRTHYFSALRTTINHDLKFAVLIDKSKCYPELAPADIFVKGMSKKEWVVFPWEVEASEQVASDKCYGRRIRHERNKG